MIVVSVLLLKQALPSVLVLLLALALQLVLALLVLTLALMLVLVPALALALVLVLVLVLVTAYTAPTADVRLDSVLAVARPADGGYALDESAWHVLLDYAKNADE